MGNNNCKNAELCNAKVEKEGPEGGVRNRVDSFVEVDVKVERWGLRVECS